MFNAIEYTQELEKAGFSRPQAEAIILFAQQFATQGLVSKKELADLDRELRHMNETLEYKTTIKVGTLLAFAVGILLTLQKLLGHA